MAESYTSAQVDNRTFGQQISRVLDDLNRPDLQGIATSYLQDSMRYWGRRPFFFTDADNTGVPVWAASTNYPQGSTIQAVSGGITYVFVALNAGISDVAPPAWPATFFTPPTGTPFQLPPPAPGTAGTVIDNPGTNQITWGNNGVLSSFPGVFTQLSTVYNVNQYVMPIDLVAFTRVEVTWANSIRYEMLPVSYSELRDYDVIRPTPPTTYPTWYAWYQQQLYLWPYPVAQYPITISYRSQPQMASGVNDINIWTTKAEALVRHYAEARICEAVITDTAMAQFYYDLAEREFNVLQQQGSQQDVRHGVVPSEW